MAGKTKWGHLKAQYPVLTNPSATYEEKIKTAVDSLRGTSIGDLTLQITSKQDEKDVLEERLKYVDFSIEVAKRALGEAMEHAGFDSVVSNGYTWTPTIEPYPQVKDKAALKTWAEEHASEALTLNPQTLKSIVKDALESNEPLPAGVEVFLKSAFSQTAKES